MDYVELHCKSNFSFLEGASSPDELVERAGTLGYRGLAITDRHSVAGIVRAWTVAKELGLPLITGAEVHLAGGAAMVLWASDRRGYGNLCRLLSRGRLRSDKGDCALRLDDLAERNEGLLAGILSPPQSFAASGDLAAAANELASIREIFADDRAYLVAELLRGIDDARYAEQLRTLSQQSRLPLVAAGDVYYHARSRMLLQDCVTAIRRGTTVDGLADQRQINSEHHLRSLADIARVYQPLPGAIERTLEIAQRCPFRLDELRYEYPEELAPPGLTPLEHLTQLVQVGARERFPGGVPRRVQELIDHELGLIEELRYEAYFLTVWDLVRFARSREILCQGRGSAANSAVCFCLGITSINPAELDVLFERFISRERGEAPDIDVDFEHQRREEVLQYIYQKYGRHRCGMTATVICYRTKSAIRDVGKALGIDTDRLDTLTKISERERRDAKEGGRDGEASEPSTLHRSLAARCENIGIDPTSRIGKRFLHLVEALHGFPRHLSQHVGGMVMTRGRLDELCPIENAAMPDRTVIQWDKDDLDALGILKVDCLALGMLTALHRCFDLVAEHHGRRLTLATIPQDDAATYDMICAADTVGVFQIESRAQMSMLPRLRPRCYYDLVIEVAIVRPGPIQGQMVHPYLKARRDPARVRYPNAAIRTVLERTLGVPIFQEQAMRLAVVAAGFTPGEADQLRRAMAAWRRPGVIDQFRQKLLSGMQRNGLTGAFAEQVFTQIRGFGEYGFPESHAASFALLVYASAYLKRHYPAAFFAAMLNSQPMGFYAPAQLVSNARASGVTVLPADVNRSRWDCTLEAPPETGNPASSPALRLGLRMIRGLSHSEAAKILGQQPFIDLSDMVQRCRLSQAVVTRLADADALADLASNRRAALWHALAQEATPREMPLFETQSGEADDPVPPTLLQMSELEEVYADYRTTGLSLKKHPIAFCRSELHELDVLPAEQLPDRRDGRHVRVAGIVLLRQRPGTAKGITFATIEDETGTINLVLFPKTWQRFSSIARRSNAWLVQGKLENREGVIHVIVSRLEDLTRHVEGLRIRSRDFH